jgi:hypothetical protein
VYHQNYHPAIQNFHKLGLHQYLLLTVVWLEFEREGVPWKGESNASMEAEVAKSKVAGLRWQGLYQGSKVTTIFTCRK